MYNKEILDRLVEYYGEDKAIIFCEMEANRIDQVAKNAKKEAKIETIEYSELLYDRDWWAEHADKLKNKTYVRSI